MTSDPLRPQDWRNLPPPDPNFGTRLVEWFKTRGLSYPWRSTRNPYHILCAEVMLQRTRAEQVAPVFVEFSSRYSAPQSFLDVGRSEAHKIFNRLGLKWRAAHFWRLHETLVGKHGGQVPRDGRALESLPGVGEYASTATRVFAFGERLTVVDSNSLRILGRYFGTKFPDHARKSRRVLEWASLMCPSDADSVRKFNWALIDLGALVCTPRSPYSHNCPLAADCWYARSTQAA